MFVLCCVLLIFEKNVQAVTVLRAVRGSGEWERVLGPPLLLETRRAVSTQLQNELQICEEQEQAEEKLRHWRAAIDVDEVVIALLLSL